MENKFFESPVPSLSVVANPEAPKNTSEKLDDFKDVKILAEGDTEKLKELFKKVAQDPEVQKNFYAFSLDDAAAEKICGAAHQRELYAAHDSEAGFDGLVYIRPLYLKPPYHPILSLFVDSEQRGKGVGQLLIKFAVAKAKEAQAEKIILAVSKDNLAAKGLYEKMGFEHSGETEDKKSDIYSFDLNNIETVVEVSD